MWLALEWRLLATDEHTQLLGRVRVFCAQVVKYKPSEIFTLYIFDIDLVLHSSVSLTAPTSMLFA